MGNGPTFYQSGLGGSSSGSGAGRVNFLTGDDTNFTNSTGNWAGFDEGAVSTPVDLTGGTPTVVTFARGTAFDSTGNLRISHSAADGQGEGLSILISSIEAEYFASVMDIEFNYQTSSGYADDDLQIWVYDVTNSVLIQPSAYKLKGSLTPGKFKAQFQTSATGTSYRVGFFCPNTTATAYTVDIDNVIVGPSVYNYGVAATDWKAWTPVFTNVTTSSTSGFWRRVGDSMEIQFQGTFSAQATGAVSLAIPTGYAIDTAKIIGAGASGYSDLGGHGIFYDASTGDDYDIIVKPNSSTALVLRLRYAAATYVFGASGIDATNPVNPTASGDIIGGTIRVPILGWSSSVQMSSDADQRRCTAAYWATANATSSTSAPINFDSKIDDSHGAVTTGANWKFTAPTPGKYAVSTYTISSTAGYFVVYKNGSAYMFVDYFDTNGICNAAFEIELNAGDYFDLRCNTSGTVSGNASLANSATSKIFIHKIQGPSAIGATETISCSVYKAANQTGINTNASFVKINLDTTIIDTHGAFASNKWTCPAPGTYDINATLQISGTNTLADIYVAAIYKNGALLQYGAIQTPAAGKAFGSYAAITAKLVTGDYIELYLYGNGNNSASTLTATCGTNQTIMNIRRIGI